ncbi:glycosyltransferase [Noviherbaspirillum galbum]|uniref:Glycosyltransferase family 4 protein n=1 Tax=Noviherbaspirillum galbum TaxID=2709383 RepID=A0A6B3SPA9_9BURK|nr:glycosyltransferase [Noviherbaspirillum galbum]NEX62730.1 glycosyltransferase family 4 protein [Noviherbaspirillum galbum]
MRILIAHNGYQYRGGEDTVVEAEVELLRSHGHEVALYSVHNDEIERMPKVAAAMKAVWSGDTAREAGRLCDDFQPDVVHSHNTFPLISPSLYWTAARRGIPVVQTLHNFRLLCPQPIFLRDGKICEDCMGKLPWRSVVHRCYRDSAAQSAVVTGMLGVHRMLGTYRDKVTRYIALNRFARDKYIEGGLPADKIRIKPNFIPSATAPQWSGRRGGLYVGRLSTEKGIGVLLQAAGRMERHALEVVGSGPLEEQVRSGFGAAWLGHLSLEQILRKMQDARYLVVPSICYENSPRTIVEAFSSGLPVIASRLGALADIVNDGVTGLLFNPGDPADLAAKMAWADDHPEEMVRMGMAARAEYEASYTPARNHEMLVSIYEDAIATIRGKHYAAQGTTGTGSVHRRTHVG